MYSISDSVRSALVLGVCLVLFIAAVDSAVAAPGASEILKATGVKGGLVVHLGCGDGSLVAELGGMAGFAVHGLDTNSADIEKARNHIRSKGLYGKVSVERFAGGALPYTDNLVNLIVCEDPAGVSTDEMMRALAPMGAAYIKTGGKWETKIKPRPADIDEWTHFLHGAGNNAVSSDTVVGPPRHVQWIAGPKFARAHEQLASVSAAVSAQGRIFYIIDEGPKADVRLPAQWSLIARDAFNGVLLWKRRIKSWADHLRRFRSGPPDLAFRLVAAGDRVYVTDAIDAGVSALDAATGKTLWAYKGTENARQILCLGDKLILLIDTQPQTTSQNESDIRRGLKPAPGARAIVAAEASSGKILWRKKIGPLVHPTVAAEGNRIFYQTGETLFCLDTDTAEELWRAPIQTELKGHEVGWESPTLVVAGDVVYYADFKKMTAFSAKDGKRLWDCPAVVGYNSPPDVFVIDDLVWLQDKQLQRTGLDPLTGELKRKIQGIKGYMHHRCYRNKATDRFILLGAQGVQFLDIDSGENWQNYWIRGTCQYGIMPANGLLYIPPDSCACNLKIKLNGLFAVAPARKDRPQRHKDFRFEKGPAYGNASSSQPDAESWPTYRHDSTRSGITKAAVSAKLKQEWQADIAGRLSSVTAADSKVFVASVDDHSVHALDAKDGSGLWSYTAAGRIDSAPTFHDGLVLFGSADGWVYALRASDGRLAWRFRAAPKDRRIFVNGQLESVWPVHGSVLVKDDVLTVAAGRSSYVDGGIYVYRLDPKTGRAISQTVVYSPEGQDAKQPAQGGKELRGVLSDILSTAGDDVYMRHMKVDFAAGDQTGAGVHLFTPIGFLDDSWWHRAYWLVSDQFTSHWSGWWKAGNIAPSGRILSYNESSVFGYGRNEYKGGNTGQWRGGEEYQLFAFDRNAAAKNAPPRQPQKQPAGRRNPKGRSLPKPKTLQYQWTADVPLHVTALLVADETMFIAGPPDVIKPQGQIAEAVMTLENPQEALETWRGKRGGAILWAVSASTGEKLAEYKLDAQPVFDGMAAANGKLFLSQKNGKITCFAPR